MRVILASTSPRRRELLALLGLPFEVQAPSFDERLLPGLPVADLAVEFACGKARSRWMPVELLLQPKVLAGQVTVTPPAYTGREAVTIPLDTNEITAMEGAEVVLELASAPVS